MRTLAEGDLSKANRLIRLPPVPSNHQPLRNRQSIPMDLIILPGTSLFVNFTHYFNSITPQYLFILFVYNHCITTALHSFHSKLGTTRKTQKPKKHSFHFCVRIACAKEDRVVSSIGARFRKFWAFGS